MSDEISQLSRALRQVRIRLFVRGFLEAFSVALLGAALLTGMAHVARQHLGILPPWSVCLLICCAASFVASLAWAWLRLPSRTHSALCLDEVFGLQERLTTALLLTEEQLRSPAGQALLADIRHRVQQLPVATRFPIRLPRATWLVPAAALGLGLLVAFYHPSETAAASKNTQTQLTQAKDETKLRELELLREQVAQRRKRVRDWSSEKFEELEAELDRLLSKAETSETDAEKQALIQDASRLAEELAARQKELSRVAALQQQLRNDSSLKEMDNGPAKDFQDALSKGDLTEARKQLEKLAQMIREGNLSEEEKQKLAQQLKEIQEKLQQLAELKKRREAVAKSNLDPETKRKELQRLDREMEKLRSAAKLAEQLGRCQQCLSRDDIAEASRALDAARNSLDEMIRDAQELAELEAALADLDKLKECLGCKSAGGRGSDEEDDSDPPDEERDDPTEREGRKDRSRGGKRKEKATDTDNKEERARAPIDPKGRILFQGYGPQQMKPDRDFVGKTTVDIGPALEETQHQASEAVRQQKLPQAQRDMVHEFYRNLLEQTSKAKPRE